MKSKQLPFILALILCSSFSFSQLRWTKSDSLFGNLPTSIKVYTTNDSLDGRPFKAYYIQASLKDKKLEFTTQSGFGSRYTPSTFYAKEKNPYVVVNGTFFSFQTNQNLNLLIKKKKLLSYNIVSLRGKGDDSLYYYYPTRSALGISKKGKADVAWTFTDSNMRWVYAFEDSPVIAKGKNKIPTINKLGRFDWRKWRVVTAMGGGPTLIHDGKINVTNREEQMFVGGENDKHPRTAMGYTTDGKLIILVIEGRFPGIAEGSTLDQEAKILVDLGCYEALNLDGGGSSCLLVNGKETIKPSDKEGQRPVPGVFIIRKRK